MGFIMPNEELNDKQAKFAKLVVELGNQAEAYRIAYRSESTAQSCAVSGHKLANTPHIAKAIQQHREDAQVRHEITVDKLLDELEEARIIASTCETPQSSAMVSATMSKAKLLGLDKQIIDHRSSDGSMTPQASSNAVLEALARKHADTE